MFWVQETGGRLVHKVVQVQTATCGHWSPRTPTRTCRGGAGPRRANPGDGL